jgi:hypothetical protein
MPPIPTMTHQLTEIDVGQSMKMRCHEANRDAAKAEVL